MALDEVERRVATNWGRGSARATLRVAQRGLLAALLDLDPSLLQPLLAILGPGPSAYDQLGVVPGRHGNPFGRQRPAQRLQTRDGRWVAISASTRSIAERVMILVARPDIAEREWFASARERVRHADQLDRIVADWVGARDLDAVMTAFEEAGAAIAPIYDTQQVVHDPHVQATGMITTVEDFDLGPLQMHNLLFRLGSSPGRIRFTGRGLGQDTDDVYGERLDLDRRRFAELRAYGVI